MQSLIIQLHPTPELIDSIRAVFREELAIYKPPTPIGADLPDLLTRKQTAKELQVSLTTLHEWAKDTPERPAVLIPLKLNGRVRYRKVDVLSALKESRRFKNTSR